MTFKELMAFIRADRARRVRLAFMIMFVIVLFSSLAAALIVVTLSVG